MFEMAKIQIVKVIVMISPKYITIKRSICKQLQKFVVEIGLKLAARGLLLYSFFMRFRHNYLYMWPQLLTNLLWYLFGNVLRIESYIFWLPNPSFRQFLQRPHSFTRLRPAARFTVGLLALGPTPLPEVTGAKSFVKLLKVGIGCLWIFGCMFG